MYGNDNNNDENEDEYDPLLSEPEYNASQAFEALEKVQAYALYHGHEELSNSLENCYCTVLKIGKIRKGQISQAKITSVFV